MAKHALKRLPTAKGVKVTRGRPAAGPRKNLAQARKFLTQDLKALKILKRTSAAGASADLVLGSKREIKRKLRGRKGGGR